MYRVVTGMIVSDKLKEIIESSVGDEQTYTTFRGSSVKKTMDQIGNRLLKVTNQRHATDLFVGSAETIMIIAEQIAHSETDYTSPMFRNLVDLPVTADEVDFGHAGIPEVSAERLQSVDKMLDR
jgi:hypothetical protein